MKKLLTFIMLIFTISMFSQEIEYPRYEVDSLGQKVVVMTIRQAMILDNNSDLLILFKKYYTETSNLDNICIKVINDKDVVIKTMNIQISKLESDLKVKDDKIKILQNELIAVVSKNELSEKEVANRNDVINQQKKQITNLKVKMYVGGIGGALIIVGLVVAAVVN